MRPRWDETYLDVARAMAKRSLCSRAQVGAVITNVDQRIVAASYNGPPRNFDHRGEPCTEWCPRAQGDVADPKSYADCRSLHAEANALMSADKSTWQGGTIFVTGDVCSDCAKLIANSGLSMVIVLQDGDRAYRESEGSYRFLRSLGIAVEVIPHG